jgi:cAMP-dependent protein kinase regulator
MDTVEVEAESEEDEDEFHEEEVKKVHKKDKKGRQGVSAECFGKWNKKGDFVPPVIPKSEETKEKIQVRLAKSFLFNHLETNEMNIVINAMQECKYEPSA